MSNRKEYSIGSCSEGESFDLSRSPSNSVTGNKAYYIGACSIGESFNLSASPYNSVSNSITYILDNLCQYGCFTGDSEIIIPSVGGVSITGYDYYGSIGPSIALNTYIQYPWVNQCDWIVYCDGPVNESEPMTGPADRYSTRWVAYLQDGYLYYGKVSGVVTQVSTDLVPQPVINTCLGFAFDSNGRPVFSISDTSSAVIYRYVAGIATAYSFTASKCKLFFNGTLQVDNGLWDVVCYYIKGNSLYSRYQRDNFGIERLTADGGSATWSSIKTMAYSSSNPTYHYLAIKNGSGSSILRCGPYPLWPVAVVVSDTQTVSTVFLADGTYTLSVDSTESADSAAATVAFNTDGLYFPVTFTLNEAEAIGAKVALLSDGAYTQTIVLAGTVAEPVAAEVAFNADGAHTLTIVSGGSYSEGQTATVAFNADGDYSL